MCFTLTYPYRKGRREEGDRKVKREEMPSWLSGSLLLQSFTALCDMSTRPHPSGPNCTLIVTDHPAEKNEKQCITSSYSNYFSIKLLTRNFPPLHAKLFHFELEFLAGVKGKCYTWGPTCVCPLSLCSLRKPDLSDCFLSSFPLPPRLSLSSFF